MCVCVCVWSNHQHSWEAANHTHARNQVRNHRALSAMWGQDSWQLPEPSTPLPHTPFHTQPPHTHARACVPSPSWPLGDDREQLELATERAACRALSDRPTHRKPKMERRARKYPRQTGGLCLAHTQTSVHVSSRNPPQDLHSTTATGFFPFMRLERSFQSLVT